MPLRLPITLLSLVSLGTFATWKTETATGAAPPSQQNRPTEPGTLTLTTERVVIFKDGYGLFVKSATATADSLGVVRTDHVPEAAVLGTFWAIPQESALKSTIAEWVETVKTKNEEGSCLSTIDLLRANIGKTLTLGRNGTNPQLTGKIIEVLDAPAAPTVTRAQLSASGIESGPYEVPLARRGGELFVIDVDEGPEKGRLVLHIGSVSSLSGKEVITHCVRGSEVATRTKRLSFDFGREAAGKAVTLRIFYFTPGVRWIPTYRVDTGNSAKAEVSLQAEILNEEEDFAHAALDLVVGVPNFKLKDAISPMSLEQALRSTLSRSMPSLMGQNMMSNAMFSQRAGERFSGNDEVEVEDTRGSVMSMAAQLGGETQQDFFVYPVKGLALKKGARAVVPLWRHSVPQRHVYTVELGNSHQTYSDQAGHQLTENKVWHRLELTDDTDMPFTTGAAMMMQGAIPLGQDLLGYTSPGGTTQVPVTIAVNMRANQIEQEVSRKQDVLTVDRRQYTLVSKKGRIQLVNKQKHKAITQVVLRSAGKIDHASHNGKVVLNEQSQVNHNSAVSWEVVLEPGQALSLTYDLALYL